MAKISIRTLMLITLGVAMLIAIFTGGASSANMFHTILVLAFAIPGASWGYDRTKQRLLTRMALPSRLVSKWLRIGSIDTRLRI